MHPSRAAFPLSRVITALLLLAACGVCAISAESLHARKHLMRRAPDIETQVLPDGRVALSWRASADSLILEKRESKDGLFSRLAGFSRHQRSFTDSTLIPNTTNWYRLRPTNARYIEEFGPETSVTISLPSPPPPRLTRIATDTVLVQADTLSQFAGEILIEHRVNGIFVPVGRLSRNQRTFRDGGLSAGGYHHYRLRSTTGRFAGEPSPSDSILMDLSPPINLALVYLDDHSVRLSWQQGMAFPCASQIERRSPDRIERFHVDAGVSAWIDEHLNYDERTYYRICSISRADSSDYCAPLAAYYVLKPPASLRADPVHNLLVHLNWSHPDSLAAAFTVERSADSVHFTLLASLSGPVFSYTDSLNTRGHKWYYRVVSISTSGRSAASDVIGEFVPLLQEGMALVSDSASGSRFYCDALEISAALYVEFCRETNRDLPEDPGFTTQPDYWTDGNLLPAVNVSWRDAIAFCNWRSISVGLLSAYAPSGAAIPGANGYRLLSRREFRQTLRSVADTVVNLSDNGADEPVKRNLPLAPQLVYDLIGNVWEWSSDTIADGGHVILGGAFSTPRKSSGDVPEFCYRADYYSPTIGFRCALPAGQR